MKIIISRTDKIGDLVVSIPSFYMVKKMYPKAELIVLAQQYSFDIIKNLPYIDKIILIDQYSKNDLFQIIKKEKPDIFIALFSNNFICEIVQRSGAKVKIGPYSKFKSFFTYNKGVIQKRSFSVKHEAEYNLDLIKKLDPIKFNELYEINTDIVIDQEIKNEILLHLKQENILGKKLIGFNIFSGGSCKNLSVDQYEELVYNVLQDEELKDVEIFILLSKQDEEKIQMMKKRLKNKRVHFFVNEKGLLYIAALIEQLTIFIGPSTGTLHIASALKKKIIGIYSMKKTHAPKRWGAFNNSNVHYIFPEKGKKEKYDELSFLTYNEKDQNDIIKSIKNFLTV